MTLGDAFDKLTEPARAQDEARADRVDTHDEIFDALHAFLKLTLLLHSGSPWSSAKAVEWQSLQIPILNLVTADHLHGYQDPTTKGLCDLGRAVIGVR